MLTCVHYVKTSHTSMSTFTQLISGNPMHLSVEDFFVEVSFLAAKEFVCTLILAV